MSVITFSVKNTIDNMSNIQLVRQTATYICWHLIGVDYLPHTLVEKRNALCHDDFSLAVTLTASGLT